MPHLYAINFQQKTFEKVSNSDNFHFFSHKVAFCMNLDDSYLMSQALSLAFAQYIVPLVKMVEIQIGEVGYRNYQRDQSTVSTF